MPLDERATRGVGNAFPFENLYKSAFVITRGSKRTT